MSDIKEYVQYDSICENLKNSKNLTEVIEVKIKISIWVKWGSLLGEVGYGTSMEERERPEYRIFSIFRSKDCYMALFTV